MKSRTQILFLALAMVLLAVTGCSNHDGNEWERVVCEVESINEGLPLVSAYLDLGSDVADPDDDTYPIDTVPVIFRARPFSSAIALPEDGAQSWFHVTNYDLTWHPGPGTPAEITDYNISNGLCDAIVPVNDFGVVNVLIADRTMKDQAWFQQLYAVPGTAFTAACELTFKGHESGNTRVVTIDSGLMVTFVGAVVQD